MILPFLMEGQSSYLPSIKVRTTDGSMVSASEIVKPGEPTLVIFWAEGDREIYSQIGSINEMIEKHLLPRMRIVAICNTTSGVYGHIDQEIMGNDLDVEVYMDVNGELNQAMGLPQSTTLLLFDHSTGFVARYLGTCSCAASMISPEMTALLEFTDKPADYNSIPDNY